MAFTRKVLIALFIIYSLNNVICKAANNTTEQPTAKIEEEELIQSETKDGKLEIIKRIKKVNPDGSYTIGYEADDGSFKIESRDVLGNIKGTYGFVDDEGEVKRVSYSSSNASDVFPTHEPVTVPEFPTHSVVQRIAKTEKSSSTTRKPNTYSTTTNTPSTTPLTVIQSIARRRASSTTTIKPNYINVENIKSNTRPNSVIYTSAAPRVLLQRPSLASTVSTIVRAAENKSEGQISRPEVFYKPTQLPALRNLPSNRFEDEKPVTEETQEVRSNILRRQLPQDTRESSFNADEHVYNLQQSLGHNDVSDIYNNGATVTSQPLFTTTRSNRIIPIISSTTASPVAVPRPTPRYSNYQRSQLQEVESNTAAYSQPNEEVTSTEPASTSTNLPVVQIPANNAATPEPLVAIRHPFQQGAILVPLSQLQNRIIPVENMREVYDARRQYGMQQRPVQLVSRPSDNINVERQEFRKLNAANLRPLPVQVDENGIIREMPQHIPTPYPLPVPISVRAAPIKQVNNDVNNDIENIQPPVSTRDFQTLLNQLIIRQKKLERISALTNPKLQSGYYQPQPVQYEKFVPSPQPYFVQRVVGQRPDYDQQRQDTDQQPLQGGSSRKYVAVRPQQTEPSNRYVYQYRQEVEESEEPKRVAATYERQQVYLPNRRAERLLIPVSQRQTSYAQEESETQTEEYLPAEVREMLLLRMLQLAMNPALPLDGDDESQQVATVTTPQYRKAPVRNVEILGEEEDETDIKRIKPVTRTKRYKDEDMDYME